MAKGKPGRCEGTYITLIERVGVSLKGRSIWQARCDCGTVFTVRPDLVAPRRTVSCGCNRGRQSRANIRKAAAYQFQPGSNRAPASFNALMKAWK